jgi:uncharacterized membrane protein YfcA
MWDNYFVLVLAGIIVGALGTLIGAGGGFLLVPLLILTHHSLRPEVITAISIAVVAANAISGSIAYARASRIDYKAGLVFALFTIPGSVFGVYTTQYIPRFAFRIFFGVLLMLLACVLFLKKPKPKQKNLSEQTLKRFKHHTITDKSGDTYSYFYDQRKGIFISIIVGYLSPLLGIGGGIIHVPALVQLLNFPVHIATATSHFILAIMSLVSVIVHAINGTYNDTHILRMVIGLSIGAIAGAQFGAYLSHKIKSNIIVRALAICLGLVGLRLLIGAIF